MKTSIINLDDDVDKKVAILKIERNAKSKNIILQDIIKEYFDKIDASKDEAK